MPRNPILEEIYTARNELLAEYDGDLAAYIHNANERALSSGHPVAKFEQRKIRRPANIKPVVAALENQSSSANDSMMSADV